MSLTVPKAGVNPGPGVRASNLPKPTFGRDLEGLGQIALQVGTGLETDRLNREFMTATTDMTRDVNNLRLEVEAIGDPDAADQAWSEGTDRLAKSYLLPDPETQISKIDPKNEDRFTEGFQRLIDNTAFQVGRRNLGLRNAQREASWVQYAHEATRAAAGSEAGTRETLIAQGQAHIAGLERAGVIDASEAERRRIALRGNISNARAIDMVSNNPEGFLAEAEGDGFSGLEADTLARYRVQAQGVIQARNAKAKTETGRLARARAKEIGNKLSELRGIFGDGRTAVDENYLASEDVAAHPDFAETMAARNLRDEQKNLARMTPDEISALIADERGRKVKRDFQTERLKVLEDWLSDHETGYSTDPIDYAAKVGFDIPDLPEFDALDPEAFMKVVDHRREIGIDLTEMGHTDEVRIFTNDELEDIREIADVSNDPAERAALAVSLSVALGDSSENLTTVLDDPVLAHVGGLISSGGGRRLGEEILRGQQAMDADNVILPPLADRIGTSFEVLETVFSDLPAGEAFQASITKSADALYARRMGRIDPASDIDEDVYAQALHDVMGGTGAVGSRQARGGIQEVRDGQTVLPAGVPAANVEAALSDLGTKRVQTGSTKRPAIKFDTEILSGQLRAASGGQVPDIDGDLPNSRTMRSMNIQAVGDDQYIFVRPAGAGLPPNVLMNDAGEPFTFSLRMLLREVGK